MTLAGQVAWVTGAGRGIGRSIALELAARGVKVLVTGRAERPLGEVVGEIAFQGGAARHLDAAAARAIELWGRLDIVVANAGLGGPAPLTADDPGRSIAILETNLTGSFLTFRAAARAMKGPGALVAVSSVLGKFGVAEYAAYCASKAGVQGLVRATALELGPRGITANAICPGWVDTEMAREGIAAMAEQRGISEKQAKQEACERFPLGRFLEPEEVARFVVFLAGPDGRGITGQSLSICGGSTAFGS
jgi:NAD(P)-dependent dehydrogenase (short-subunit alcohol dehydrogenase family)